MGRCRLREDHAAIRDLLARIGRGEAGPSSLRDPLVAHLDFEEREVLPLLAGRLPRSTGPVRTLLEDHAALRGLLEELEGGAGEVALRRLRTVLLAHLEKEEELILPFAHNHFCAAELERIGCVPSPPTGGAQP